MVIEAQTKLIRVKDLSYIVILDTAGKVGYRKESEYSGIVHYSGLPEGLRVKNIESAVEAVESLIERTIVN